MNGLANLCRKERTDQRVEAANTEVRQAEVDDCQFFLETHRSEINDAASCQVCVVRRSYVLRDWECRAGQTDPSRYPVIGQRRPPDQTINKESKGPKGHLRRSKMYAM